MAIFTHQVWSEVPKDSNFIEDLVAKNCKKVHNVDSLRPWEGKKKCSVPTPQGLRFSGFVLGVYAVSQATNASRSWSENTTLGFFKLHYDE